MSFFGPDYGAAQSHINELMAEREDFVAASVSQAQTIAELRKQVKGLTEDLDTTNEQLSVQTLIAESRARQLEEARIREAEQAAKADKLRSSVRVLWGLMQEMQMRLRDQQESVAAGNEVRAFPNSHCILSHWPLSFASMCVCARVRARARGPHPSLRARVCAPLRALFSARQLLETLSELLTDPGRPESVDGREGENRGGQ